MAANSNKSRSREDLCFELMSFFKNFIIDYLTTYKVKIYIKWQIQNLFLVPFTDHLIDREMKCRTVQ